MPTSDRPDPALAAAVRALRKELGATQEDIAYAAGLTINSYRDIELGRSNPAWTTVQRIAEGLEVDVLELVRRAVVR